MRDWRVCCRFSKRVEPPKFVWYPIIANISGFGVMLVIVVTGFAFLFIWDNFLNN
ncbi:MAG: hypothetical protein HKN25_05490 [Pyrinomonadaceae bacterium]|nr:hypothetical protein [Pyrinomonadaceae bacterium]